MNIYLLIYLFDEFVNTVISATVIGASSIVLVAAKRFRFYFRNIEK